MTYFASMPADIYYAIQWTGSNLTEVETFAEENCGWALPLSDLGDGVLGLRDGAMTASTGDWVSNRGLLPESVVETGMQVLTGAPPFYWTITGS
jgi:hypothetical protein